jgi:hypothetical protein
MAAPNSLGIYLYAIIPTGEEISFDVAGAGEDDEVYTIPHDGIAAVVSASPLPDYRGLKRNEAALFLVIHQRVVETIMQDFPLLPAKFGTVLADETHVRRLLEKGKDIFRSALVQYADKVQMEVVVLWNVQQVFQEIAREESVVQLKAKIGNRPAEETLAERTALGQMVQASLERRRAALGEEILPALREIALDVAANPLMDDSMVANVALLVDKAGHQALDWRLEALDGEYARGERKTPGNTPLTFRCVGPLPPYSFTTVEVQALPYEVVDAARRYLGLGETTTPNEIKRAYHRLAGQMHPDHNPNLPEAAARMTELARAYQLLTAYADAHAPQHPCTYSREAVEQTLLIAIRRQEIMA